MVSRRASRGSGKVIECQQNAWNSGIVLRVMSTAPSATPACSILFVDGTNLGHRLVDAFGREDVDYVKFFAALTAGTKLLRTHYCTAPMIQTVDPKRYARQVAALNVLRTMPDVEL